ncbi:hypothetical protein BDQ17DRAFT_1334513 [Cyathus striatus]|nr:hypothetical protein BDQ17DRAFT_1334513 [Cyathus striatus]
MSEKSARNNVLQNPEQFENFMRQYEYSTPDDTSIDLQGASKIIGGHSCQNALGNIFNIGDKDKMIVDTTDAPPSTGVIKIYNDLFSSLPIFTFRRVELQVYLYKLLKYIGTKYKSIQVSNPYVFLWEDNRWSLTGQYSELLEDKDQEVQWELDEDKSTFCRILLHRMLLNLRLEEGLGTTPAANITGVPSVFSEEASTSTASMLEESTEAQKRIIDFFKVPLHYVIMELAGKWQNKMPPISVIATIFTSVPVYYRWKALFSKLSKYPKMELWFEGNPDISDYEVWKGEPQTQEALKIILKKFGKEDKKLAKEKDEDSSADDNYKSKDKGKGKERVKEKRKDGKRKKKRGDNNFLTSFQQVSIHAFNNMGIIYSAGSIS